MELNWKMSSEEEITGDSYLPSPVIYIDLVIIY